MTTLSDLRRNLVELSYELSTVRVELKYRKLMLALKAGFNADQPRDERGRWTSEGGVEITTYDGFLTGILSIDNTSEALSDILTM